MYSLKNLKSLTWPCWKFHGFTGRNSKVRLSEVLGSDRGSEATSQGEGERWSDAWDASDARDCLIFFRFSGSLWFVKPRQKLRLKTTWRFANCFWCGLKSVRLRHGDAYWEVCLASGHATNCPSLEIERKMVFPQFLDLSMSACWLSQHTNLKRELEAGVFAKLARQQMVHPGCCMLFSERLMRLGFSLVMARSFGEAVRINFLYFLYPTRPSRLSRLMTSPSEPFWIFLDAPQLCLDAQGWLQSSTVLALVPCDHATMWTKKVIRCSSRKDGSQLATYACASLLSSQTVSHCLDFWVSVDWKSLRLDVDIDSRS